MKKILNFKYTSVYLQICRLHGNQDPPLRKPPAKKELCTVGQSSCGRDRFEDQTKNPVCPYVRTSIHRERLAKVRAPVNAKSIFKRTRTLLVGIAANPRFYENPNQRYGLNFSKHNALQEPKHARSAKPHQPSCEYIFVPPPYKPCLCQSRRVSSPVITHTG